MLTTRPSFTDAWLTVPFGSFQAENGLTYTAFTRRRHGWTLPESLLKLGLGANTELRLGVPNYIGVYSAAKQGLEANHWGDLNLGFSHHVGFDKQKLDLAVISVFNLPTGANRVSSNGVDPQLRLVLAKTFRPGWVVASQLDARWFTAQGGDTDVMLHPTLIAYQTWAPKFQSFVEYGGFFPTQGRSQQYLQAGVLFFSTPRQQWDVRLATGLNQAASNLIVGVGYSFRIDGVFPQKKEPTSF